MQMISVPLHSTTNNYHLDNNREVVDAKVGYTSLTKKFIGKQIQKDALLLKEGTIKGSQWHFFRSPVTGKIGATKPLLKELNRDGLKLLYIFNYIQQHYKK